MRAAHHMKCIAVPIVTAFLVLAPSMSHAKQADLEPTYASKDAVRTWANKAFLGGYEEYAFSREGKEVLVVVGMPTSGVPSSEIVVFQRAEDGRYGVMLTRTRMIGFVKVREDKGGIVFSAKNPILVIPWSGVVVGWEQVDR